MAARTYAKIESRANYQVTNAIQYTTWLIAKSGLKRIIIKSDM